MPYWPRSWLTALCYLLLLSSPPQVHSSATQALVPTQIARVGSAAESRWWLPSTGPYTGHFEASVSFQFWNDYLDARNLQWRGQFNLPQGLRLNAIVRSNRQLSGLGTFAPAFDELYLEARGYHFSPRDTFSFNARYGRMRYQRFPFPDLLSIFDLVPGMEDLEPDPEFRASLNGAWRSFRSSLNGLLVNLDYQHLSRLGLHSSLYQNSLGEPADHVLEAYTYYRAQPGPVELELRAGRLQWRDLQPPVPSSRPPVAYRRSRPGASLYLGSRWRGIRFGFMVEQLRDEDLYAGILLQFSPHPVSNFLGSFHLDYTRVPEGFALQLPLVRGSYGYLSPAALPAEAQLVGEVISERRSTFWGNSQTRNFFEHEYQAGGEVQGDDLAVLCLERSWYLKNESPIGRLDGLSGAQDIRRWDHSSARLGEVAQPVVYRFYRLPDSRPPRKLRLEPGVDWHKLWQGYRYPE